MHIFLATEKLRQSLHSHTLPFIHQYHNTRPQLTTRENKLKRSLIIDPGTESQANPTTTEQMGKSKRTVRNVTSVSQLSLGDHGRRESVSNRKQHDPDIQSLISREVRTSYISFRTTHLLAYTVIGSDKFARSHPSVHPLIHSLASRDEARSDSLMAGMWMP